MHSIRKPVHMLVLAGAIGMLLALALPGSGRASGQLPAVELVGTWGCDACDGPQMFGAIESVEVATDGTVFVTDAYEPAVRRFSPDGDAVSFGREGQGPAEFGLAWKLAVVADRTIEIIDVRNRRITRLDFDGNEIATRPVGRFPTAADYVREQGAWFIAEIDFGVGSSVVVRLPDGAEETSFAAGGDFPLDEDGEVAGFFPIAAAADGRIAIGDGNLEYRIRLFDGEGEAIGDVFRDIPRTERSEAEMEAERARHRAIGQRAAEMARAEGAGAPAMPAIDPFKRHFSGSGLAFDDAGRLWVMTERGNETRTVFDVFDRGLGYVGELEIPGQVRRYGLAGEWLVTTSFRDDYPIVRLWRVS